MRTKRNDDMAFVQTVWEYSNEVEMADIPPEGDRFLYIRNAMFDDNTQKYMIYFTDLGSGTQFMVSYNLNRINKTTLAPEPNTRARGTLISLNRAMFNVRKGIPNPVDIIGGVVSGEVVHREYQGKMYVNIYTYSPVPEDIVLSDSKIDQYYIGYPEDDYENEGGAE